VSRCVIFSTLHSSKASRYVLKAQFDIAVSINIILKIIFFKNNVLKIITF
jgi:hypothetical protein